MRRSDFLLVLPFAITAGCDLESSDKRPGNTAADTGADTRTSLAAYATAPAGPYGA